MCDVQLNAIVSTLGQVGHLLARRPPGHILVVGHFHRSIVARQLVRYRTPIALGRTPNRIIGWVLAFRACLVGCSLPCEGSQIDPECPKKYND